MSKDTNTSQWNSLFETQKSQTAENEKNENLIDRYYFIFDCSLNLIEYVNYSFETIMQYKKEEFTIDKLIDIIHPEDKEYFFQSEEKGLKFTNSLSFNEHFRYFMSYSYRVKTSNGTYIRVRQQCQGIEVNLQGHLTKTLVIHQKIADENRSDHDYRVFDKYKNIYLDINNFYNLSQREREILDLIQQGFNSLQISEILFISKYTIDTHRKNILNKTNATNFLELTRKMNFLHES